MWNTFNFILKANFYGGVKKYKYLLPMRYILPMILIRKVKKN